MFEREDWPGRANAIIRERICALPEFARARSHVVNNAIERCRGRSVSEMRRLGGFSAVIQAYVRRLPPEYRINYGSKLFPRTVQDVLGEFVPAMRTEVQFACAQRREVQP